MIDPDKLFKEWDEDIAPQLHSLESRAWWIKLHAQEVAATAKLIKSMPEWETRASAELQEAIKEIMTALEILNGKQRGDGAGQP